MLPAHRPTRRFPRSRTRAAIPRSQRASLCRSFPPTDRRRIPPARRSRAGSPLRSRRVQAAAPRMQSSRRPGWRDRVRGEPAARCPTKADSAASDVRLARFGLRIIRAMQPSAARGKTARVRGDGLAAARSVGYSKALAFAEAAAPQSDHQRRRPPRAAVAAPRAEARLLGEASGRSFP